MGKKSVEQHCRDLLEFAIQDGLVFYAGDWDDPHPQARSSGELFGMANMLVEILRDKQAEIERLRAEKRELRAEVDMMLRRQEWLELVDPEDEEFEDD